MNFIMAALLAVLLAVTLVSADSVLLQRIHDRYEHIQSLQQSGHKGIVNQEVPVESQSTSDEVFSGVFSQKIDHFNVGNNGSFLQRYYVNSKYYQNDGAVFIYVGGEAELRSGSVARGSVVDMAQKFNGLIVGLEHRFYGKSHPFRDLSRHSLEYLTSQQALSDLANFIQQFSKVHPELGVTSTTKWIVVGGSYPGNLSAWFRLKYPHLVVGSWASSAPVVAKSDFWEYDAVVSNQLGAKCGNYVREVTKYLESKMANQSAFERLKNVFHPLMSQQVPNDISFLYILADIVAYAVQYDNPGSGLRQRLCLMENSSSGGLKDNVDASVANFGNFTRYFFETTSTSPRAMDMTSYTSETMVDASSNTRQWMWQCCLEFAYWQSAPINQKAESLRSKYITAKWHEDNICHGIFGFAKGYKVDIDRTNAIYGASHIVSSASNIFFTNGDRDPWKALGIDSAHKSVKSFLIKGTAHCSDLRQKTEQDPEGLVQARHQVEKQIGKWLKK